MRGTLWAMIGFTLAGTLVVFAQENPKVQTGTACAGANDMSKIDPMVRITTMPTDLDKKKILTLLSQDVSRDSGLDIHMVTYYWQTFDAIVCPGCDKAGVKEVVFVDLYVPGFMTDKEIGTVMTAIADSLDKHTDYARKDLFIHAHVAGKGRCFLGGEVVTDWSQVGGPADAPAE